MTITQSGNDVILVSPYDREAIADYKQIGGKWDPTIKSWRFDVCDEEPVQQLAAKYFGYSPDNDGETVTIRVHALDYVSDRDPSRCVLAGRVIARRPGRDADVKLSHGVVLVSGAFSNRGGSHNNPRITD